MRLIAKFKSYVENQISKFDRQAIWPLAALKDGLKKALWWIVPSFVAVWLVEHAPHFFPKMYMQGAIAEGIGVFLWNVMGTLGISMFGLSMLFPRSQRFTHYAYELLSNTFAIGALSFGLIFGKFVVALAHCNPTDWKTWAMAGLGMSLMGIVFLFNFAAWYLSALAASRKFSDGFFQRLELTDSAFRITTGMIMTILPIALLMTEK